MSESWNYIQNGVVQGPVPEESLVELLSSGKLGLKDLVWHQGLADWTKAGAFPHLRAAQSEAVPPAFPAPQPPPPAMERNLFQPPAAEVFSAQEGTSQDAMDAAMEALRGTKPWVRFLAVLGIIGTVFMTLGALTFMAFQNALGGRNSMPPAMRAVVPVIYLVMAAINIPPIIYLNRFANRIGALLESRAPQHLAEALEAQKSFWRYVGIMALLLVIIYALVIVFVIGFAAFMGAARRF